MGHRHTAPRTVGACGARPARSGAVGGAPYAVAACPPDHPSPRPAPASCAGHARSTGCSAETYPDARIELDFDNAFELLVVTVLSAQTTDRRVNAVRPTLFAAYPDPAAMAAADRDVLEGILGPLGFFRAKTDAVLKLSAALVADHGGQVPAASTTSSSCRAWAARPPTSCSATPSASPGITVDTHFGRLVAPLRLDRRDRPGQGRARDRRAVPQARLDDARRTT